MFNVLFRKILQNKTQFGGNAFSNGDLWIHLHLILVKYHQAALMVHHHPRLHPLPHRLLHPLPHRLLHPLPRPRPLPRPLPHLHPHLLPHLVLPHQIMHIIMAGNMFIVITNRIQKGANGNNNKMDKSF